MKHETIDKFKQGFKPASPSVAQAHSTQLTNKGSGSEEIGRRPLLFDSPHGAGVRLQFDVNMAKCKWRPH